MSAISSEFPFDYAQIEGIGKLFYPVVRLGIKSVLGWQEMEFLVDTGADMTTIPDILLPALGIDKKSLKVSLTKGVGGFAVKTWDFKLNLRLGREELWVMASAVETRDKFTPLLLGRKDIFEEKFNLLLDSRRKVTVITVN